MHEACIRLMSADIRNFKNVGHGHLDFESKSPDCALIHI